MAGLEVHMPKLSTAAKLSARANRLIGWHAGAVGVSVSSCFGGLALYTRYPRYGVASLNVAAAVFVVALALAVQIVALYKRASRVRQNPEATSRLHIGMQARRIMALLAITAMSIVVAMAAWAISPVPTPRSGPAAFPAWAIAPIRDAQIGIAVGLLALAVIVSSLQALLRYRGEESDAK